MVVPAGVTLVTLNIDPPVGVSPAGLRIRVDPTWPDVSWSANGQALGTMLESPRRGVVSVKVPAVDQNGFVNSDGQVMKGWQYVLTVEGVIAGASIRTVRLVSPKAAGGTLTFGVAIGEGGSASLPSYLDKAALDGSYAPVSRAAKNPDEIAVGAITRSVNGAATGFGVKWDDGATGVFVGTESTTAPGAIDSYTVTHVLGGVTTTYTQPALTRDANGAVTARPAMTVS